MLTLYNSLSNKKEKFSSINKNKVTIYVCGITPYDTTHLGHAFTYISFDALIKYLKFVGNDVSYTQNVTDINDRDNDILKRAKEQKVSWKDLSKFWTTKFLKDMKDLNWTRPNNYLYASKNIVEMMKLIQKLIKNGLAYEENGSIYLDISKDHDYGKLSKLTEAEMVERALDFEEDVCNPDKRNPLDITLWKKSAKNEPKHIPSFKSPFGMGRPGWHLECSAMATSTLGEQIDIHGGGIDLIFPHHEAEIAQSEGASGKVPFAKFFMHCGIVAYKGKKMSKSDKNLVMVSNLLKKYDANAIRYLLISNHYRSAWEYLEKDLKDAQKKIELIKKELRGIKVKNVNFENQTIKEFRKLMDDDLNTPQVLEMAFDRLPKSDENTKENLKIIYQTLGFKI